MGAIDSVYTRGYVSSVSVLFVFCLLRGVLVTAKKCSEEGDCLLTDEVRKTVSHAPLLILDVNCTVMRVSSVRTGVYSLLRSRMRPFTFCFTWLEALRWWRRPSSRWLLSSSLLLCSPRLTV